MVCKVLKCPHEKLRRMKTENVEMILETCAGLYNLRLKNSKSGLFAQR